MRPIIEFLTVQVNNHHTRRALSTAQFEECHGIYRLTFREMSDARDSHAAV